MHEDPSDEDTLNDVWESLSKLQVQHVPDMLGADPWGVPLPERLEQMREDRAADDESLGVRTVSLDWWRAKSSFEDEIPAFKVSSRAFGVLREDNPLRRACILLLRNAWFDRVVLFLILLNSILLAAQDPRADETLLTRTSEILFNLAFTLEMLVKVTGLGAYAGEESYFRDPWNRFDFVTVVCGWLPSIICVVAGGNCFSGGESVINLTFLRVVRVIKVLKTVQRIPGMRCLVLSLVKSAPLLVQVMEVLMFIFFCFAAIGVQLFSGKLRQACFDKTTQLRAGGGVCSEEPRFGGRACRPHEACRDRDFDGSPNNRDSSLNRYISFDNILLGFATVLSSVSLEGWSETMYAFMDAMGPAVVVYFVLLVLIGSFFVVNLIVAVIYQAYVTEETRGANTQSGRCQFCGRADVPRRIDSISWRPRPVARAALQDDWDIISVPTEDGFFVRLFALPDRHLESSSAWTLRWWALRDACCWIASRPNFDRAVMAVILFNTIVLIAEYDGESELHAMFSCHANRVLVSCFVCEMVVKMLGTRYVFNPNEGLLNLFDAVITVGSVVELVVEGVVGQPTCHVRRESRHFTRIVRPLRLVRIGRSLRLVRHWPSMAHILSAVQRSGPGLLNFSCLLAIFAWVYALAGMQMYAGRFNFEKGPSMLVRPRTNFDSLGSSLLTVFIVVSGENWDSILNLAFKANGYIGLVFVVSMYLVGNFIVLNIFLAILLSNFETALDAANTTLYDKLEESNEIAALVRGLLRGLRRLLVTTRPRRSSAAFATMVRRLSSSSTVHVERPKGTPSVDEQPEKPEEVISPLDSVAEHMQAEIEVGTHHRNRREYHDCFTGATAVDWMLEAGVVKTVRAAVNLGQKLVHSRLIVPVDTGARTRRNRGNRRRSSFGLKALLSTSSSPSPRGRRRSSLLELVLATRKDDDDPEEQWTEAQAAAARFSDNHGLYRFCARNLHRLHIIGDPDTMRSRRKSQRDRDRMTAKNKMLDGGASFFIFGANHPVRRACVKVVSHQYFDVAIMVLILLSSVLLAATPAETTNNFFFYSDVVLTVCFLGEMLLKMIAEGLLTFLHSGWNVMDFVIVSVSVVSLTFAWAPKTPGANFSYLKALRSVRALRPLRMIKRYPAMKTVVDALLEAVPDVLNVALVVGGFFCIFAVAGGTLFRGLLSFCHAGPKRSCDDWGIECRYDFTTDDLTIARRWVRYNLDKRECRALWKQRKLQDGGLHWHVLPTKHLSTGALERSSPLFVQWRPMDSNFDNIANALLALFEIATLEGWPNNMFGAMDTSEVRDKHPTRNGSAWNSLFFVVFIVLGSFFVLNIFVGVVVHKFQVAKERTDGAAIFLTEQQRAFVDRVKVALDAGRPTMLRPPAAAYRRRVFFAVTAEYFEWGILAAIILNMAAISLNHYDQSRNMDEAEEALNGFFAFVFLVELLLKIVGLGVDQYWADPWNRFDAVIVATSMFDATTTLVNRRINDRESHFLGGFNMSIFRICRLVRAVKLIHLNPGLKTLLKSLIVSLPSLVNVGSLLVLLIFVYACIGMHLYNGVEHSQYITKYCNFDTFGYSMLTLFRCLTGEDWNKVMLDIVNDGQASAYAFFTSFMILGNFMLLNLCVAVILEAFAEFMNADSDNEHRKTELRAQVACFKQAWLKHDTDNTSFIPVHRIVALLHDLPPPLGVPCFDGCCGNNPTGDRALGERLSAQQRYIIEHVRSMRLKVAQTGDLFYLDVLMAVLQRGKEVDLASIGDDSATELNVLLLRSMDPALRAKMHLSAFKEGLPELDLTQTMNAALTIQDSFRLRSSS